MHFWRLERKSITFNSLWAETLVQDSLMASIIHYSFCLWPWKSHDSLTFTRPWEMVASYKIMAGTIWLAQVVQLVFCSYLQWFALICLKFLISNVSAIGVFTINISSQWWRQNVIHIVNAVHLNNETLLYIGRNYLY